MAETAPPSIEPASDLAPRSRQRARVVQFRNRRYSLKLEDPFWHVLERAAARREVSVRELVARLATDAGNNLASRLRTFCMAETERAGLGDQEPDRGLPFRILDSAPAPALVLGADQTVIFHNRALALWLEEEDDLVGQPLTRLFSLRARLDWAHLWGELVSGRSEGIRLHVVRVAKGRTLAAGAHLVMMDFGRDEAAGGRVCLLWLSVGQPAKLFQP